MTLDDLKKRITDALDKAGYDIAEGKADLFTIDGCDKLIPAFGTSFGNNPAAPYIVPAVPQGNGEDYYYGESMRSSLDEDLYWTYRLGEHEAILMFGNMPPEGAFIGYETFLFTRHFDGENLTDMDWLSHSIGLQHHLSPNPDNLLYDSPPITAKDADGKDVYSEDPDRVTLFANGPTINRRTLEKMDPNFWGKQAIFSTSADADFKAALDAELEAELAKIHLHSPLGPELKMGLSKDDDDFWTLMRYAVPKNETEGDAWRQNLENNLVVLRVTRRDTVTAVRRHPAYEFPTKEANSDERVLAADLQKLADAVATKLDFGAASSQEIAIPLSNIPLHAPESIPMAMSAVGATHDADYRMSLAKPFESQEVFAIVGVNHTRTGNASYVSLGIYDSGVWKGIKGISQGAEFPTEGETLHGSAEVFFQAVGGVPTDLDIDLSRFYVQILARHDAVLTDSLVDSTCCTLVYDTLGAGDVVLEAGKKIRVTERAYLNPSPNSSCGPDHTKLLSMIVLARGKV